jgi:hypothetical protein
MRYTAPFAARIVQKSRRHRRQARENEAGFADLRARAGDEARFFKSLFEEISAVPDAVDDTRHDFSPANVDGVVIHDQPRRVSYTSGPLKTLEFETPAERSNACVASTG